MRKNHDKKRIIPFRIFLFTLIFFTITANIPAFTQEQDSLRVDDILRMSFSDLMNVEVTTASKMQQQIKNVAATVQVITADQIKKRGYFTLEETLSDLPGFQFRNINGFNSYVFVRGAPNQNNLVLLLVDGVEINELNSGGFYGGGQHNLSNVERIEVVYGPASSLYGTNAVSGIINIITKPVDSKQRGHVSLLGGNFNTAMTDFRLSNYRADKDFGYSVSGMYKTTEKANLRGAEGDNNWTNNMENFEHDYSLSAKLKFKAFEAGIEYQQKLSSLTTSNPTINNIYLDRNTLWNIAFTNGFLKYTNDKNKKLTFNSRLYLRDATVKPNSIFEIIKATDSTTGNQVGYYRPNRLVGIENQLTYKPFQLLTLTGGLIGELEQLSEGPSKTNSYTQYTAPPTPSQPNILNKQLISFYLQTDVKISDYLSFIGGVRFDFSSYYGQPVTPRTGLVFNKNKLTAKLLCNTAYRAPKPWDYYFGAGNSNLKPERMKSFEANFSYLLLDNLQIGASGYKNIIHKKLVKETVGTEARWVNKDSLNTLGFEIYANYSIKDLKFEANYTFTDSYDQDEIYIPEISMHTANVGVTYSFQKNITVNLRANYTGGRKNPLIIPATNNDYIDDAMIFNGCVSYLNFHGFDFQLKVNNILNQKYYHPNNIFAGRYRQPQRNFTLKIIYNF